MVSLSTNMYLYVNYYFFSVHKRKKTMGKMCNVVSFVMVWLSACDINSAVGKNKYDYRNTVSSERTSIPLRRFIGSFNYYVNCSSRTTTLVFFASFIQKWVQLSYVVMVTVRLICLTERVLCIALLLDRLWMELKMAKPVNLIPLINRKCSNCLV